MKNLRPVIFILLITLCFGLVAIMILNKPVNPDFDLKKLSSETLNNNTENYLEEYAKENKIEYKLYKGNSKKILINLTTKKMYYITKKGIEEIEVKIKGDVINHNNDIMVIENNNLRCPDGVYTQIN